MKKTKLLLVLFTLCLNAFAQTPAYVPASGLVAWIPFDGNLNDYSGNGNNGTGTGYTYIADRNGVSNSACNFSGITSYTQLKKLPINTHATYTLNFWLKLNAYAYGAPSTLTDVLLDMHPDFSCSPYPDITMYNDSINAAECDTRSYDKPLGYKTTFIGIWRMISEVFTPDTTFLYVDANLVHKYAHNWGASSDANLTIANNDNGTNRLNHGADAAFDDLGVWSRALTNCEISELYNASVFGFSLQPVNQSGKLGTVANFTCTASSSGASYQWQSNIGTAGAYVNLSNTGQYSGVTTNTLTVTGLTTSNDAQQFRCIVTNPSACTATSAIANLSITNLAITEVNNIANNYLQQNMPNPTSGNTQINYYISAMEHNAHIELYDAVGRKIKTENINKAGAGSMLINKGELGSGVYFYTLFVDGLKIDVKKMIINN